MRTGKYKLIPLIIYTLLLSGAALADELGLRYYRPIYNSIIEMRGSGTPSREIFIPSRGLIFNLSGYGDKLDLHAFFYDKPRNIYQTSARGEKVESVLEEVSVPAELIEKAENIAYLTEVLDTLKALLKTDTQIQGVLPIKMLPR